MTEITFEGRETVPLPELPGVEHHWLAVDDITMHVATAGHGTPVVLLHGFPQHWWEWRDLIGPLAEHHRVICPDLRGAGWTDAPRTGYRAERLTQDVLTLLDLLDLDRVHMVAHDWGAIVAFHLALEQPERIASLVSMSIPHPYARFTRDLLAAIPMAGYQFPLILPGAGARLLSHGRQPLARYIFANYAAEGTWTDAELEPFLAPLRDRRRAATAGRLYRGFIQPSALRLFGPTYKSTPLHPPTLVLTGDRDAMVRADLLAAQTGPADHLEVQEITEANHYVVDEQPGQVLERIRTFLADHPAEPLRQDRS